MKDYLIIAPMIALALFPPIFVSIPMVESTVWIWIVLIFGFLGFWTWTLKINIFIKLFTSFAFITCFFSSGLYVSFTRYIPLVLYIYYFIICQQIKDWQKVRKALAVVLAINVLMVIMQATGNDRLCNFALEQNRCSGITGNWMQFKSLLILITAFFIAGIQFKNPKFLYGIIALLGVGMIIYAFSGDNISHFPKIRFPAWSETLRISSMRPWFGWGLASFGPVFNAMAKPGYYKELGYWLSPHNSYLHILFELGNIVLWFFTGYLASLGLRLLRYKLFYPLIGFILALFVMSFHFPLHQTTTVLLAMCFFAYLETRIKERICLYQPQMSV